MKIRLLILFFLVHFVWVTAGAQSQFKALLVTTTKGWHHESLHAGVLALQQLGKKNYFDVVLWENPNGFTDTFLAQFKVIIFLNTTGDIFDSAQQSVMERFIQAGNGFVGIHSASDTEYDWSWYTRLVGRMFYIHPAVQTAKLNVLNPSFPGLAGFENGRLWTDEWYEFGPEKVAGLQYILAVDENSYNPKIQRTDKIGVGMGPLHPVAWVHNFDGGRAFYTALGHNPTAFADTDFLNHLLGGIRWAATGRK